MAADHPAEHLQPCSRAATSCTFERTATALCAPQALRSRLRPGLRDADALAVGRRESRVRPSAAAGTVSTSSPCATQRRRWPKLGGRRARRSATATCGCTPTSPAAARSASRTSWPHIERRLAAAPACDPHPAPACAASSTCRPGRRYRSSPREAIRGLEGRPGLQRPVPREADLCAPPVPAGRHGPPPGQAARSARRARDLRQGAGGRGRRPRHQLPARARPAPCARRRMSRTSRPVPFFVKAPGQTQRADQRQAAAHGRRSAHARRHPRGAHPLADRRPYRRAPPPFPRPAAAPDHREEVPPGLSSGHARLRARAAAPRSLAS